MTASFDDFMKIDIRLGTVVAVDDFPEARKPAWKLVIDFGDEIGTKNHLPRSPNIMARMI